MEDNFLEEEVHRNPDDSDERQKVSHLNTVFEHCIFAFAITALFILPIVLAVLYGTEGFIGGLVISIVTSPVSIDILRTKMPLNIKAFGYSLIKVLEINAIQQIGLTLINIFLFAKVCLNTLLTLHFFGIIFFVAVSLGFLSSFLLKSIQHPKKRLLMSLGVAPLVVNLFFLINYGLSSGPFEEKYFFTHNSQIVKTVKGGTRSQRTTFITLENNQYENYPGLRLFMDYNEMQYSNEIIYTFEKGLFGIPVMKDYTFR